MNNVLTLLLSHQPAQELELVLQLWQKLRAPEQILLAYGGTESAFSEIAFPSKVFIDDPRLRMRDHPRERQSCTGVLRAARAWLQAHLEFDYVHYVEYDQVPLLKNLYQRLVDRINAEQADILAYHLKRIDGTSHPHYLYHNEEHIHQYFASISVRRERQTVLSMLGTGAFWRREAFEAIAAYEEPFPIYVELYVPTLAHHLGYRLRDLTDQNRFVTHKGDYTQEIEQFRSAGAWTVHPVKKLPLSWGTFVK